MKDCISKERIEKVIKEKNISVNKALTESMAGKNLLANIAKGQIPSIEKIILLADYLEVSIDYLLGRTEQTTQTINNQESNKGIQAHTYNAGTREKEYDDVSEQLLKEFKKLSLKDKSEAIRIICEMAEKEN